MTPYLNADLTCTSFESSICGVPLCGGNPNTSGGLCLCVFDPFCCCFQLVFLIDDLCVEVTVLVVVVVGFIFEELLIDVEVSTEVGPLLTLVSEFVEELNGVVCVWEVAVVRLVLV